MIRHIVFFSAKDKKDIPLIRETLAGYCEIPSVAKIEVAENRKCDGIANDIDVVLYAEFESQEALEAYKQHPIYQAGTDIVRPIRELRFAADIES